LKREAGPAEALRLNRAAGPAEAWRSFRREKLSHPFDETRADLDGIMAAARLSQVPLYVAVDALRRIAPLAFYDTLTRWNSSMGYAMPMVGTLSLPERLRSSLSRDLDPDAQEPAACTVDAEALQLQMELAHGEACGCDGAVRYVMEGSIGIGAEVSALLKPFAEAYERGIRFLDPMLLRVGCEDDATMSRCLGLLSTDGCSGDVPKDLPRCHKGLCGQLQSARHFSRLRNSTVPSKYAHRGLFWWTAQVLGYLLRPNEATEARLSRKMAQLGWDLSTRPTLALHVRRGDTCMAHGRAEVEKGKGRVCDLIEAYAARARLLISRHGFKSLYVATDDAAVAAAVTARSEELFGLRRSAVFVADVDRTLYARGYYNKVLKQTPADEARADAEAILDDVLLLAHADGFVGKFTSNVARLAVALSAAHKGCIAPFDSLDSKWCADFGIKVGESIHGDFLC